MTVKVPQTTTVDDSIATEQYRVAQEAINNAIHHGNADHVRLALEPDDEYTHLRVKNDGLGLPEDF